ncbi:MAG: hypothetical protein ACE5HF_07045 [Gemmatimonadota bacterium]
MTDGDRGDDPPQLHIWDASAREVEARSLADEGGAWAVVVLVERAAPDLFRGRLSFRRGEDRLDTEPVLVEESEAALLARAAELPASTLRQFLRSLAG